VLQLQNERYIVRFVLLALTFLSLLLSAATFDVFVLQCGSKGLLGA